MDPTTKSKVHPFPNGASNDATSKVSPGYETAFMQAVLRCIPLYADQMPMADGPALPEAPSRWLAAAQMCLTGLLQVPSEERAYLLRWCVRMTDMVDPDPDDAKEAAKYRAALEAGLNDDAPTQPNTRHDE